MYFRYYPNDTDTVHSTQQDYAQSVIMTQNEEAITNIIKGYCLPSGLPWHLVDEVYVPVNFNEKFSCVLTVISLKDRRIRVYDSLSSLRNMKSINEIHKLAMMLPIYLSDNRFLDCGVYIAGYVEYLNEGMNVPSVGFEEEYHRIRYTSLLQKYGIEKAKKGYVSENDDPPRPRTKTISILDETGIVSIL
ncbi:hypothetical protein CQW23_14809 [Capsicum baccatum]|uniref:Ubiquitin-like protease family profile domain-containing protein n=1 Tax=Capsicum baccatum TaxID=33114 RepID=A0A2G2WK94_CAPBA|nr:hypothetical protein CQW23_14809 [Capsicum baccatum]